MKQIIFLLLCFFSLAASCGAETKIRITTTSTTLAGFAAAVAGDLAMVESIVSPKRDIHFISPTPKDILKVRNADVFVHAGLDLEVWRAPLLEVAGNPGFLGTAERAINASTGVALLDVPVNFSRVDGDIHLYGNPHYWTDPENAKVIVQNIARGLCSIYPRWTSQFEKNGAQIQQKLGQHLEMWRREMEPYRGTPVVCYHKSWPYFAKRFGLEIVGQLEPKPGIPPAAKHLAALKEIMRQKGVKIILKEPYQESRLPGKVARETGAVVLTLAQEVGATPEATDYFTLMDSNLRKIREALHG